MLKNPSILTNKNLKEWMKYEKTKIKTKSSRNYSHEFSRSKLYFKK